MQIDRQRAEAALGLTQQLAAEPATQPLERAEPVAARHDRLTHRNGYRHRELDTCIGTIDVAIPKLRSGT